MENLKLKKESETTYKKKLPIRYQLYVAIMGIMKGDITFGIITKKKI